MLRKKRLLVTSSSPLRPPANHRVRASSGSRVWTTLARTLTKAFAGSVPPWGSQDGSDPVLPVSNPVRAATLNSIHDESHTCHMNRISTLDLRAHLGELLDRVRLRYETFVIERKGREVAALIPAERARRLEDFARRRSLELEAVQASYVREKGFTPDDLEAGVARATREVKAARKRRVR